ncbi:hypothetical protein [Thalassolituus oleivorans]|uniref:hypothetical protein n=1 Tax=Thalassolituus oleivorans TaxID=187493 RepID=UPI0023F56CBB|nr:hypothetical protein [Thalassolituus oleivorans]
MNVFDILLISWVFSFLVIAVSWLIFSRFSIPAIDKRMAEAGAPKSCPIDIMGLRVFTIANAISLPVGSPLNHRHDPFIDVDTVRKYVTPTEKRLGLILSLSIYTFLTLTIVASLYIPDK